MSFSMWAMLFVCTLSFKWKDATRRSLSLGLEFDCMYFPNATDLLTLTRPVRVPDDFSSSTKGMERIVGDLLVPSLEGFTWRPSSPILNFFEMGIREPGFYLPGPCDMRFWKTFSFFIEPLGRGILDPNGGFWETEMLGA